MIGLDLMIVMEKKEVDLAGFHRGFYIFFWRHSGPARSGVNRGYWGSSPFAFLVLEAYLQWKMVFIEWLKTGGEEWY